MPKRKKSRGWQKSRRRRKVKQKGLFAKVGGAVHGLIEQAKK